MQKPIEEGCLVVCTAAKHFGFTTTAVRRVEPGTRFMGYRIKSPSWVTTEAPSEDAVPVCPERYLRRLDGYEPEADETLQEVSHDAPAHA